MCRQNFHPLFSEYPAFELFSKEFLTEGIWLVAAAPHTSNSDRNAVEGGPLPNMDNFTMLWRVLICNDDHPTNRPPRLLHPEARRGASIYPSIGQAVSENKNVFLEQI